MPSSEKCRGPQAGSRSGCGWQGAREPLPKSCEIGSMIQARHLSYKEHRERRRWRAKSSIQTIIILKLQIHRKRHGGGPVGEPRCRARPEPGTCRNPKVPAHEGPCAQHRGCPGQRGTTSEQTAEGAPGVRAPGARGPARQAGEVSSSDMHAGVFWVSSSPRAMLHACDIRSHVHLQDLMRLWSRKHGRRRQITRPSPSCSPSSAAPPSTSCAWCPESMPRMPRATAPSASGWCCPVAKLLGATMSSQASSTTWPSNTLAVC